jgi:hypothetical protein
MSLYSLKQAGGGAIQAWAQAIPVGQPGGNLAVLKELYDKRTETSFAGTVALASALNGPIQVHRFGDVALNGATVTVQNKCRGALLIFDSLTVTGSASSIHMNGKGAVDVDWEDYDLSIPQVLSLSSDKASLAAILKMIRSNGWFVGDPQLWKDLSGLSTGAITPGQLIVDKTQLGAGGLGVLGVGNTGPNYVRMGNNGGAGAKGPGGGSSPCMSTNDNYTILTAQSGEGGRSWRGGFGGDVWSNTFKSGRDLRNSEPGGLLIVAVLGALTVGPGLTISANGVNNAVRGGGPGAGRVLLLTGGAVTGTPTLQANGGAGVPIYGYNTNGGAGATTQSTLAAWGL